jgi:hypothetical protein
LLLAPIAAAVGLMNFGSAFDQHDTCATLQPRTLPRDLA